MDPVREHEEVILRTAHDVRFLRVCAHCGSLGDDRNMVEMFEIAGTERADRWHPKCFYEKFGESLVLELRREHQGKFRMRDIPINLMREMVRRWE